MTKRSKNNNVKNMLKKALFQFLFCLLFFSISLSEGVAFSETEDFLTVLQLMKKRFVEIEDYQCILESFAANKKGHHRSIFQYYFKKPKLIRMEVLEGKHPGTILIYNPSLLQDKVRVKLGNTLKATVQKLLYGDFLNLNDRRVRSLRGYRIHETDWGWFIDEHLRIAQSLVTSYEIKFRGVDEINCRPALFYVLTSKDAGKTGSIKKEELWIDKENLVPLQYRLYGVSGQLLQYCSYKEVKLNGGLKEELFRYPKRGPQKSPKDNNSILHLQ